MAEEKNIFEKIIDHELPAEIVYEDEYVLAFLDLNPNNPGHTIVIPKKPSRNILDITDDSWLKVMQVVHMLTPKIMLAMQADGVNIKMNNEEHGGQLIFHTHVHIIPRFKGDGFESWPTRECVEEELHATADTIRAAL